MRRDRSLRPLIAARRNRQRRPAEGENLDWDLRQCAGDCRDRRKWQFGRQADSLRAQPDIKRQAIARQLLSDTHNGLSDSTYKEIKIVAEAEQ